MSVPTGELVLAVDAESLPEMVETEAVPAFELVVLVVEAESLPEPMEAEVVPAVEFVVAVEAESLPELLGAVPKVEGLSDTSV